MENIAGQELYNKRPNTFYYKDEWFFLDRDNKRGRKSESGSTITFKAGTIIYKKGINYGAGSHQR